jgi:hypothetical protein
VVAQGIVNKVVQDNAKKPKTHITVQTTYDILAQKVQTKEKISTAKENFQNFI